MPQKEPPTKLARLVFTLSLLMLAGLGTIGLSGCNPQACESACDCPEGETCKDEPRLVSGGAENASGWCTGESWEPSPRACTQQEVHFIQSRLADPEWVYRTLVGCANRVCDLWDLEHPDFMELAEEQRPSEYEGREDQIWIPFESRTCVIEPEVLGRLEQACVEDPQIYAAQPECERSCDCELGARCAMDQAGGPQCLFDQNDCTVEELGLVAEAVESGFRMEDLCPNRACDFPIGDVDQVQCTVPDDYRSEDRFCDNNNVAE